MELGGKSPMIIFDDANVDHAASAAMVANWRLPRMKYVHMVHVFMFARLIYDETFIEQLARRNSELLIGLAIR
ncbi:aldehyde dehydrogenase family protein [Photobacterium leiognathi]|uniref:aldehyde dehydrogenase family protein n=1 Tax=Photobacterium leiognathi TaxID=553611 RepID=UPI0027347DEA|nr:aldehyde dehydrogenase family protein [Photobacterium leiognathi]